MLHVVNFTHVFAKNAKQVQIYHHTIMNQVKQGKYSRLEVHAIKSTMYIQ
jgi:hypothetical protein